MLFLVFTIFEGGIPVKAIGLAVLISVAEITASYFVFWLLKRQKVIKLFSPKKLWAFVLKAHTGQKMEDNKKYQEDNERDRGEKSLAEEIVGIWIHNATFPFGILLISILITTYIWEGFYVAAVIVLIFVICLNSVIVGALWNLMLGAGLTSNQFFNIIWRHTFAEFFSMNVLWAMACLSIWNTALVIGSIIGLLIAAIIEMTLSHAVLSRHKDCISIFHDQLCRQ
jgi:ABC-type multidrug transport system permease subunit